MLEISYKGSWQLWMALDPDPNDEPRGISGPTMVLPGEPDFDTFMYLQDLPAPRFPMDVNNGVFVSGVTIVDDANPQNRTPLPDHPLIGAAVDLLDNPTYAERGFVVLYQKMPIDPFHLRISGGGLTLQVKDLWDMTRPDATIDEIAAHQPGLLQRRSVTVQPQSAIVAAETGITDYVGYRRQRRADLETRLDLLKAEPERNELEIEGLRARLKMLAKDEDYGADTGMIGLALESHQFLGLCGFYGFPIQGSPLVVDESSGQMGGRIGVSQPWAVDFWVGGFDVDTCMGYMKGTLTVPFHPAPVP